MKENIYTTPQGAYYKKNPGWHIEDSAWKAKQVMQMIGQNKLEPHSIAEVGCGAGEMLNVMHSCMQDKTIEFSGYEISPDAIELCATRTKERLNFFQGDLLLTENKYDLLLMIDVFEHVEDYLGFIKKHSERARYKIYHIPLDISLLSVFTNYPLAARKDVGHLHYFMKDTALATLEDTGQEVIDWFYTKTAFEINNRRANFSGKFMNIFRRFFYWIKPGFAVKTFGGFSLIVLTR